jgi:molecular chaperone GrpE
MDSILQSSATEARNPFDSRGDLAAADLAALRKELARRMDAYLRLAADFDNHRKRTKRDSERQAAAEKESFIRDLLPVFENLERALVSARSIPTEQLRQGAEMTLQQLHRLLQSHDVEAVEDVGRPFNPRRHEVVSVRQDRNQPDQVVLKVIRCGYCRGDILFRPALVIVNVLEHSPRAVHAG